MATAVTPQNFHDSIRSVFTSSAGANSTTSIAYTMESAAVTSKRLYEEQGKSNAAMIRLMTEQTKLLKRIVANSGGGVSGAISTVDDLMDIFGHGRRGRRGLGGRRPGFLAKAGDMLKKVAFKIPGIEKLVGGLAVGFGAIAAAGAKILRPLEGLRGLFSASGILKTFVKFGGILKVVPKLFAKLAIPLTIIMGLIDGFSGWTNADKYLGKKGSSFTDKMASTIGSIVDGLLLGIPNWLLEKFAGRNLQQILAGGKDAVINGAKYVGKKLGQWGYDAFKYVGSFFGNLGQYLPSADTITGYAWAAFDGVKTAVWDGLVYLGTSIRDGVRDFFSSMGDAIKEWWKNPFGPPPQLPRGKSGAAPNSLPAPAAPTMTPAPPVNAPGAAGNYNAIPGYRQPNSPYDIPSTPSAARQSAEASPISYNPGSGYTLVGANGNGNDYAGNGSAGGGASAPVSTVPTSPTFAPDGTELGDTLADANKRAQLPAGMRNNNPGNLKFDANVPWNGLKGPSVNTDQGDPQAVFNTPQDGMNAMFKLARNKYRKGMTTLNQIIAKDGTGWTPGNYKAASNIAASMGIGPDDDLQLDNPERAKSFMKGLILQEHGPSGKMYPDAMINAAVERGLSPNPQPQLLGTGGNPNVAPTNGQVPGVSMSNRNSKRSDDIQPQLKQNVRDVVTQALGPEYNVDVYSGGQSATSNGRTGSNRHNDGHAGDIRITGPDGRALSDEQAAKVSQLYLAKGYGSVGLRMSGGGIHFDDFTKDKLGKGQSNIWNYNKEGGYFPPKLQQQVAQGINGVRPDGLRFTDDEMKAMANKGNVGVAGLPTGPGLGALIKENQPAPTLPTSPQGGKGSVPSFDSLMANQPQPQQAPPITPQNNSSATGGVQASNGGANGAGTNGGGSMRVSDVPALDEYKMLLANGHAIT